jgi:hypothetical protein
VPTARRDWTGSYAMALICEFTPHRANCKDCSVSVSRIAKEDAWSAKNIRRRCRRGPGTSPQTGLSEYQLACLLVNEPFPGQVRGGSSDEVRGEREKSGGAVCGMVTADDMAESLNGPAPLPPYRPSPGQAMCNQIRCTRPISDSRTEGQRPR